MFGDNDSDTCRHSGNLFKKTPCWYKNYLILFCTCQNWSPVAFTVTWVGGPFAEETDIPALLFCQKGRKVTKKLKWKLNFFFRDLWKAKCAEATERTLNLQAKLTAEGDIIQAIHHDIWNVRRGGLGSVQGVSMVSIVIENKDLLTQVKEPQNVPLEEGNTAPRDLQGLATLGLTRWVINPCVVLWWIPTTWVCLKKLK